MSIEDSVLIRMAGIDDVPIIRGLAEVIWPATYHPILSAAQIRYMMELMYSEASLSNQMNEHTFLIASSGGRPVGFASYSGSAKPGTYKLHKLYVLTSTQGMGLGRALINCIIEQVKRLNATGLELNVNRNNKARLFYEKLGFEVIGEEDIDIGENYWMNDYVMRLQL